MKHIAIFGSSGSLGTAVSPVLQKLGYKIFKVDQHGNVDEKIDATLESRVISLFDKLVKEKVILDGLLNLVGQIHNRPFFNVMGESKYLDSDEWTDQFKVNLDSAFYIAKHYHRYCSKLKIKCNLINVSSVSSEGNPGQIAYSASKAALEVMTKTLAKELGTSGHRFNVLAPGFINVDSTKSSLTASKLAEIEARTPLRSLGNIASIANGIHFLLASDFVTGHVLKVDGGIRI